MEETHRRCGRLCPVAGSRRALPADPARGVFAVGAAHSRRRLHLERRARRIRDPGAGAPDDRRRCWPRSRKVNTRLLNISKDAGGAGGEVYIDVLESGAIACVIRHQMVDGRDRGYVSYQLNSANKRAPVDGWATLAYMKELSPAEAAALGGPGASPTVASAPAPPPAASAPAPAAAPGAAAPPAAPGAIAVAAAPIPPPVKTSCGMISRSPSDHSR